MEIIECQGRYLRDNLDQFIRLYEQGFRAHHPNKTEFGKHFFEAQILKKADYVDARMGKIFAAIEKERILGWVHVYARNFLDELRLVIADIVVDESFRGSGIGRKLYEETKDYALNTKCDAIEVLSINTENATGFYHSLGFENFRIDMVKKLGG